MKTWNTTDKSEWSDGEWQSEPDKAHWIDETTGLDCLIVRGPSGALCGYVGVPEDHRLFEKDYGDVEILGEDDKWPNVHGGLTFSDRCRESDEPGSGVCHQKEDAANDVVWWLGFDCAHLGDICPKYDRIWEDHGATYKTFSYVKREVQRLAEQVSRG